MSESTNGSQGGKEIGPIFNGSPDLLLFGDILPLMRMEGGHSCPPLHFPISWIRGNKRGGFRQVQPLSKQATVSMWLVWGNMSTGCTEVSLYPLAQISFPSLARFAGLQLT